MTQLNSLTINEKTYDSFRDQQARERFDTLLPRPGAAFQGQVLQVHTLDAQGRVAALAAVEPLAGAWQQASLCAFGVLPQVTFEAAGYCWWKVSELTPSNDQLLSAVFSLTGTGEELRETPAPEDIVYQDDDLALVMLPASGLAYLVSRVGESRTVQWQGASLTLPFPEPGIYLAYDADEIPPETWLVGVEYEQLRKLQSRFLPEETATKAYVQNYLEEYLQEALGGEY